MAKMLEVERVEEEQKYIRAMGKNRKNLNLSRETRQLLDEIDQKALEQLQKAKDDIEREQKELAAMLKQKADPRDPRPGNSPDAGFIMNASPEQLLVYCANFLKDMEALKGKPLHESQAHLLQDTYSVIEARIAHLVREQDVDEHPKPSTQNIDLAKPSFNMLKDSERPRVKDQRG